MVYPRISRFIIILPFSKQPQRSFPDKVQTQVSSQVQICEIPMDSLPNSLKNPMDFPTTPSTFFPVPPSPAGAPAGLPPWPRRGNGPRPRSGAAPDWHLAATAMRPRDGIGKNRVSVSGGVPYRFVNVFAEI